MTTTSRLERSSPKRNRAVRTLKNKSKKICKSSESKENSTKDLGIFVTATLVDAEDANDDLCRLGELDETKVNGTIVLCRRGSVDRTEKSLAVERAGGVGTILYNSFGGATSLFPDLHSVKSVHISYDLGAYIKDYISNTTEPIASISVDFIGKVKAPLMAEFSSRGPNLFEHQIKPDISAPGVNIFAGHTPLPWREQQQGELFQVLSGTSMSSPHIAGAFALIKEAHPDWSPAAARSAIMSTAYQKVYLSDGETLARPFDMGSGHLDDNNRWLDPGLIYPTTYNDYNGFLCGVYPAIFPKNCDEWFRDRYNVSTEPWDLNYPSVVATDFFGSRTIHRTVQSVDTAFREYAMNYTVHFDAPPGYSVIIAPSVLSLKAGESAKIAVTISSVKPDFGDFAFGSFEWRDKYDLYNILSPIAAKANPTEGIPGSFSFANSTTGSVKYTVEYAFTGTFAVLPFLEPAKVFRSAVKEGESSFHSVLLGGGNRRLRIRLPPEATDPGADLDIFVFDPNKEEVGDSENDGTDELITIFDPMDGNWRVEVYGWSTPGNDEVSYDLFVWTIPGGSDGSLLSAETVPKGATPGGIGTVELSYSHLEFGEWYWGYVLHETNATLGVSLPSFIFAVHNRSD